MLLWRNRYTRDVEGVVPLRDAGSTPVKSTLCNKYGGGAQVCRSGCEPELLGFESPPSPFQIILGDTNMLAGIIFWIKYVLLVSFLAYGNLSWQICIGVLALYIVLDLWHETLVEKKTRKELLNKICLRRIDKIIKEETPPHLSLGLRSRSNTSEQ